MIKPYNICQKNFLYHLILGNYYSKSHFTNQKALLNRSLILAILLLALIPFTSISQEEKESSIFIDTLDKKLDVSKWLLNQSGFLPVVGVITEPATDYGLVGALIFLDPFSKYKGTAIGGVMQEKQAPPDVAVLSAFGTLNGSWGTAAIYKGYWLKDRLRYLGIAGWVDVKLDYYGNGEINLPNPITLNYKGLPIIQELDARILKNFFGGLRYMFFKFSITPQGAEMPDFISEKELQGISSTISPLVFYDNRDNIFTPNKGFLAKAVLNLNGEWIGSDYNYQLLETYGLGYIPVGSKYYIGLRYAGKFLSKDAPFFAQPYIDMRGIPVMRYQADNVLELETEHRWNVTNRWALIGFVGIGKAFPDYSSFTSSPNKVAGGGGFRYLLARLFNMYGGLDFARGPDMWAFYITVGSAWGRY